MLVQRLMDHLNELDKQVGEFEAQIKTWHRASEASCKLEMIWTYPDRTDTLGLDFHFAAEVNSAVAGMAALALSCSSFSKLMGDF